MSHAKSAAVTANGMVKANSSVKVKPDKKILKHEQATYSRLRAEALDALDDFRRCQNNFDFICEDKLIDVCIYDIQKTMSRYEYLVSELKRINGGSR